MSAGKGDSPRHNLKAYGAGWERIFGRKAKQPRKPKSPEADWDWHSDQCSYTTTGKCDCETQISA